MQFSVVNQPLLHVFRKWLPLVMSVLQLMSIQTEHIFCFTTQIESFPTEERILQFNVIKGKGMYSMQQIGVPAAPVTN